MKKPGKIITQVLQSVFKKPATLPYPAVRSGMPVGFRGKIKYYSEKCIGCNMCVRDCPTNAITIRKVGDKQFEADFNLGKCIYCGQCVDSCPKGALEVSSDFELAQLKPENLKITFHAGPKDKIEK